MYSMLRSLAMCALWASSTLAGVPAIKETYVRCGADNPSAELVATAQSMSVRPLPAVARTLAVNTYFHVVTTSAAQGSITQTQLNNQVGISYSLT